MRDAANIREVERLGVDMMGFIFWPGSARYVRNIPDYLPQRAKRVGVFVDADIQQVRRVACDYALDYIQLHGHESPDYCIHLREWAVIKAFNIASAADLAQTDAYQGAADVFLFDTKGKAIGGNGEKFDWSVLDSYRGTTPYLLSGGIGPDDASRVKAFIAAEAQSRCMGIDLNSRFETAPGVKDINKLKTFIQSL